MSMHGNCEWNCGGTDCDAPRRPTLKWSATMNPTSWEPEKGSGSINVGHPAIARGIVRFLWWLNRTLRREVKL
jgi:hypothetical protein